MKNTLKQIALLSIITVGMAQAGLLEDRSRRLVTVGYRVKNNNPEVVKALNACEFRSPDGKFLLHDASMSMPVILGSTYKDENLHRGIFNSECIQRIKETYGEDSITEEKEWQYQPRENE